MDQSDIVLEADQDIIPHRGHEKSKVPLLVSQARRISALEEQVCNILREESHEQASESTIQVHGCARIIEGLQEQLTRLSLATPTSQMRAGDPSITLTSPVHTAQGPSLIPTHRLVAPGLEPPFRASVSAPLMQSSPHARRRELLVSNSHDVLHADD